MFQVCDKIIWFACKIGYVPKNPKYDKYGDKIGNRLHENCSIIPILIVVMVLQCTKDTHAMHQLKLPKCATGSR